MDNKEIRTYHIINAIENDANVSQRHLADKLNVSLGLINSFLKRLATKGYCKIVTIQKNRVKYILTPAGAAEKTRLTYNYIKHSFELYKHSHGKITEIFRKLSLDGVTSVYFYGATEIAEISYSSLQGTGITLVGIIDDLKKNEMFLGYKVSSIKDITLGEQERIIITSSNFEEHSAENVLNAGVLESQFVEFTDY